MRSTGFARPVILLVAASLACALPSASPRGPAATSTAPATGSEPTTAVTTTVVTSVAGEWVDLPQPPPSGIIAALEEQVASGAVTQEEGLLQSLRLFTGEVQPEDIFPQVPGDLEGTGLVAEAMAYLETDRDDGARAEIERLIGIIAPDPDRLLAVSIEAEARRENRGGPGLAVPANLPLDCLELWVDGFPDSKDPIVCFEYKTEMFQGSRIRIFGPGYPTTKADYVAAALQATKDSLQRFQGLSLNGAPPLLGHVDVVFALIDTAKADALAIVPFIHAGGAGCRIVVYPMAITENEMRQTSPQDFEVFKQTVAHEMFHCYTAWNLPNHWSFALKGGYDALDWWIEGAAEYFSNVVYPATNDEWYRGDSWRFRSATTPVVYMDYDNYGLFQYLGNVLGNNGLLALLAKTPTSGDEGDQAAALAAYPNMDVLFHDYGRAFMDGKILDTVGQGVYLQSTPVYVPPEYRHDVAAPTTLNLSTGPFTLTRYGLTFKPEREYLLGPVYSGVGLDASRPRDIPQAWGDLPLSVPAACEEARIYELMTTTSEAANALSVDLDVLTKEGAACDKCLVGTWDLNLPSFTEYSEAPFAETPGFYNHDSAGGLWRYRFRPSGTFRAEFDFFTSSTLHQPGGGFGADIDVNQVITIVGPGEGTYISDGINNLTFTLVEDSVSLTSTTTINGEDIGDLFDALSGYGFLKKNDSMVYSCDPEAGILQLDVAPQAGLPPLQFDRISTDPTKP
jgi:hypothetical protein